MYSYHRHVAKLVAKVDWRWLALSGALAVPWWFAAERAGTVSLLYPERTLPFIALTCGVFWVYRRVADLVFLKRHDVGAALGRVLVTSFVVVLTSFVYIQAAYALKISESPGPRESQALVAGVFLISAAGIYRVLDGGNRPEEPVDSV